MYIVLYKALGDFPYMHKQEVTHNGRCSIVPDQSLQLSKLWEAFLYKSTCYSKLLESSGLFLFLYTQTSHTAHQKILQYFQVLFIMIILDILRNILWNILAICNTIMLIKVRGF